MLNSMPKGERGHFVCASSCIILACVVILSCYAPLCDADVTPPTGVWCDPVQLGDSVPFAVAQPLWWKEYFVFNASQSGQVGIKLYPGTYTDESFTIIVGVNYCPNIVETQNFTTAYAYGTPEVQINVEAGNSYVLLAHLLGTNYTVVGCDGACPKMCPNDCTNLQGICDLATGTCLCNPGWTGDNCSFVYTNGTNGTTPQPTSHHKIPFGSEPVFLVVVAGIPTALVIAAVSVGFILNAYRKKEKKLKFKKEKEPLINPPIYTNGANGHHLSEGNSLSLSPAFPPPPHSPNGDDIHVSSDNFGVNRRSKIYN